MLTHTIAIQGNSPLVDAVALMITAMRKTTAVLLLSMQAEIVRKLYILLRYEIINN